MLFTLALLSLITSGILIAFWADEWWKGNLADRGGEDFLGDIVLLIGLASMALLSLHDLIGLISI